MDPTVLKDIRRIAIIGGGPGGIATAKYLVAEDSFTVIDILEQQSSFGGVWVYSPDTPKGKTDIPQTNPFQPLEEPIWRYSKEEKSENGGVARKPTFISPMYDNLETNIPHSLMAFSDKPFPKGEQLFPGLPSVVRYLKEYAEEVEHLVKFNIQVLDVSRRLVNGKTEWTVKCKNLISKKLTKGIYDAVVVASGHYNVSFVPNIKGIKEWDKAYPGTITHSKFYKTPSDYSNQRVVIVGYSASGVDIASQVSTTSTHPILISQRSPSIFSQGSPPPWKLEVPKITEFLPAQRAIRFANGRTESNIDRILFCTGYLYSYPFLSTLQPPVTHATGARVQNLYQHLLYAPDPTLAFIGLPFPIIPFRTSESQAAVLARLWSGRLVVPSSSHMQDWEKRRIDAVGEGKGFHKTPLPEDFDYHDSLCDWAMEAEDPGRGKGVMKWSDRDRWARERFAEIKKAFMEKGKEKKGVRTMEQLGFVY